MYTLRGRLIIGLSVIASAVVLLSWMRSNSPESLNSMTVPAEAMYVFQGINGPSHVTTVVKPRPTDHTQYAKGASSRLA